MAITANHRYISELLAQSDGNLNLALEALQAACVAEAVAAAGVVADAKIAAALATDTGAITSAHVETVIAAGTTSATLEDVANMSTTIVTTGTTAVLVVASFEIATQAGGAPSTIAVAVGMDGADGMEHARYLSGTSDTGIGAIVEHFSLAAGTHTVKLRFRRVSGAATPGINDASMTAVALRWG